MLGVIAILVVIIVWQHISVSKQSEQSEFVLPSFLHVQTAQSGSLVPVAGTETWTLSLIGVSPETVYFSDRPNRETGREATENFIRNWDVGDDSFAIDPPNAALDIVNGDEQRVVVLELIGATYDALTETLEYQVVLLEEVPEDLTIFSSFDTAALFIDSTYKSYNCKCDPEEGRDSCKCEWTYTLNKSATKESRVSCNGTGSNVDLGVADRQPNTTCTVATNFGFGYRTKSCTNWSTSTLLSLLPHLSCSY
ncbi:MAG: hypothetical protein AAFO91_17325, partial [Bacteroidota bacterium]